MVLTFYASLLPLDLRPAQRLARVRPGTQTITIEANHGSSAGVDAATVAVFDEYYHAIHEGAGLDAALLERMNELHRQLSPRYVEHRASLATWFAEHAVDAHAAEPLSLTPRVDTSGSQS